jgi:hypothetical protein
LGTSAISIGFISYITGSRWCWDFRRLSKGLDAGNGLIVDGVNGILESAVTIVGDF